MAVSAAPDDYEVGIISCDIVGHSAVPAREVQLARVAGINAIVADTIASFEPGDVVWASGGDGGHVIFRQPDWYSPAITLIAQLRCWSRQQDVPLRVTGHYGPVTHIVGADGRVQIVGRAINFAGWLLSRGTKDGIVVSAEFRQEVESHSGAAPAGLLFHDPRKLRHKFLAERQLFLLSLDTGRSSWPLPLKEDGVRLRQALERGAGWDILYLAKRLLQVNSRDERAVSALRQLQPQQLRYRDPDTSTPRINPFLAQLEPQTLLEVVRLGQLVERRHNEVIRRLGDAGDATLVILRGQVGVYPSEAEDTERPTAPAFVHQEGDIVGELAFALSRKRTADLVALSDVALLSFSNHEIHPRLPEPSPAGHPATHDRPAHH